MKRNLAFALLLGSLAAWMPLRADNFTGQKSLGLSAGYSSYNESAVAGVEFTYRFCRNLRVAPGASYVFRHRGVDAMQLNLNVQVPLPVARGVAVYPYAGFNYSSYNRHKAWGQSDDSSGRISRCGLNLGAGLDLDLTRSLRLGVSGGYLVIRRFHGAEVVARVAYVF